MHKTLMLAAAATVLLACAEAGMSSSSFGSEAGANAGGAQDIGLARTKIASGWVPNPEDFPPEGLYAEHDLPIPGEPCGDVLCVRGASARVENVVTEKADVFVQLGLASNVDLSTFKRRALNVSIVIDHSGSMGTDKMEAVKAAAERLVDHLDEGDLLSVVEFDNSVNTLIGPEVVSDRERFKAQIRRIGSAGGTCIECGLRKGYELVESKLDAGRENRVLLFTDARPNVGATGEGEFITLAEGYAEKGIHLTSFGAGLDFGQALVTRLSAVRGSNYVFLADPERMRTVFDEDFDLLVTPIAFDLELAAVPAEGLTRAATYGVPGVKPEEASPEVTVKTVFLSRRRSALVLRLEGTPLAEAKVATLELAWTGTDGQTRTSSLVLADPSGQAPAFSAPEVRKTVALTNFLIGARAACEAHFAGDASTARALAERTATLLDAEAAALADEALRREAELAKQLAELLGAGS